MRAATACLLALSMLALGVPGATAKTPKRPASACQKLAKRYKDRSPDRRLVLVVRGSDETGSIKACVLPRGKVRVLSSWDDGLARDSANVLATVGTWVLVHDGHSDQYGGTSSVVTRVDVRSGRRLTLSSYGCQLDYSLMHCASGTTFGDIVIAANGAGAIERTDFAAGATTLQAFSPAGVFTKLADGAVDALRIAGAQIFWSQGGVESSAALPA